ncbi:MAG: 4-hydroxythreonine-4-phosphate dehydrogenase PdxA [Deltaproteobacteria bacterium]|nr:4-hydroxythreonine-4-phosphate dehydrogenase PdxA [Deltaproteobacteria bacterium]
MRERPLLAVTMGDPVGIGPEVIVKTFTRDQGCDAVVFGDLETLRDAARVSSVELELFPVDSVPVDSVPFSSRPGLAVWPIAKLRAEERVPARPTPASDRAQLDAIFAAVEAVELGNADAIVTAPISKASIARCGAPWPGHTELLAELAAKRRGTQPVTPVMMLAGERLRVVTLTTHIALAEVPRVLTESLVREAIELVFRELRESFDLERPKIALAGLNPHAGEGGLFGDEELRVFGPALAALRAKGIEVSGPIPGDAVFRRALAGEFDVVVSGYHDQALIPLKLVDFERAVNVTLGLPFVRTSVDHGTAYDLAGKGVASNASFEAATALAVSMVRGRAKRHRTD